MDKGKNRAKNLGRGGRKKGRDVEQIGQNLNSFAKDLKEIHFIVTELRIELAARLGKLHG